MTAKTHEVAWESFDKRDSQPGWRGPSTECPKQEKTVLL
jgi:hypothetical protein